jgi:hypothetical protein
MNESQPTPQPNQAARRIRKPWFAPKLPERGSWFFLRAALLVILFFSFDWFLHRSDSPPPDLDVLLRIGGIFVTLFLVLALGFYGWECRLRRQTRERLADRQQRNTAKSRNA